MSPPFQYEPYSSRPWAQSIADLLAQNPQAAAAARSGAIYGRAIQQTGQDITGSLARELDPTTQLQRQALTDVHDQRTIAKETAARAQGEKLRATVADLAFDAKDGSEFVQRLDVLASDSTTGIPKQVVAHVQDLINAGHWPEIQKSYLPFSPRYQTEQAELRKPMTVGEGGVVNTPQRAIAGEPPLITGQPKPPTKAGLGLKAAQGDLEAQKALDLLTPPKNPPSLEEQYLTAKTKGDTGTAAMILKSIADTANAKRDPAMQAMAKELAGLRMDEARARLEDRNPTSDKNQAKFEQEYRTVLARGLSSRSGGLGLEDAKVQQANHLLALLDQTYDPKTDTYNIPKVLQGELSAGLARLVAPGGQVGIEMMREFNQKTAKGDLAGALTYITGTPFPTATQDIAKMLKDSIERQGKVALENREGEMRYLRGLAPTDLDEGRRTKLEATSLNPLRQSRLIQNKTTGERKLQVSLDGGQTWK